MVTVPVIHPLKSRPNVRQRILIVFHGPLLLFKLHKKNENETSINRINSITWVEIFHKQNHIIRLDLQINAQFALFLRKRNFRSSSLTSELMSQIASFWKYIIKNYGYLDFEFVLYFQNFQKKSSKNQMHTIMAMFFLSFHFLVLHTNDSKRSMDCVFSLYYLGCCALRLQNHNKKSAQQFSFKSINLITNFLVGQFDTHSEVGQRKTRSVNVNYSLSFTLTNVWTSAQCTMNQICWYVFFLILATTNKHTAVIGK